ncbi:MAG: hypothetical protein IPP97_20355 [Candidatus Obscuribacter sp.]|nr:hypothetical protein [Candidatus Obscuribacter sp.]MBP7577687.1 hypothetical protein [Candidatus Obscuribacter sp.]
MTIKEDWKTWWEQQFPDSPPVGFLMRKIYSETWLRIHSLPSSKRYAETKVEYDELVRRHNIVATETLGEDSACYLIRGFPVEETEEKIWYEILKEYLADSVTLQFEATQIVWKSGLIDPLILEVADDRTRYVLIVGRDSRRIYAPYDGGADLFFANKQERNERKEAYKDWLSAHPDGF